MSKEEYINTNIGKLFYQWSNVVYSTAIVLNMSLSFLDYFVTPDNFKTFLIYRIITSSLFSIIYFINRKKINRILQISMLITGTIIISTMIELMVLKFGGHQSPYFVGIILTIIYVLGFMPLDTKINLISSSMIYGIYLIPLLIFDTISNKPFFISINVFILSIISFVLI